ncbi:hypothetical protein BKA93DRAFT_531277 [Sparassis latifolia]
MTEKLKKPSQIRACIKLWSAVDLSCSFAVPAHSRVCLWSLRGFQASKSWLFRPASPYHVATTSISNQTMQWTTFSSNIGPTPRKSETPSYLWCLCPRRSAMISSAVRSLEETTHISMLGDSAVTCMQDNIFSSLWFRAIVENLTFHHFLCVLPDDNAARIPALGNSDRRSRPYFS